MVEEILELAREQARKSGLSQFIDIADLESELAEDPTHLEVDFPPGTRVRHKNYGVGLVVKREGKDDAIKLTINFPGYGRKRMIQKYAGLQWA